MLMASSPASIRPRAVGSVSYIAVRREHNELADRLELFRAEPKPLFDPLGFLHLALGRAFARR